LFWQIKKDFAAKYGAQFTNVDGKAPSDPDALRDEFAANLKAIFDVMRADQTLVDYLADRLVEIGESVPESKPELKIVAQGNPFKDERLYDFENYPDDIFARPGEKVANRAGLSKWGAWVNAFGKKHYDRPLFIISSADLSQSTMISGFAEPYGDFEGYGWYERVGTPEGTMLPQEITEFTNAGIAVGMASVNLADDVETEFDGFWGACSTYGSFSYLKYGMFRLFSQIAQDSDFRVGKVIWVAGHSGPETADDSRTHFGIFSPGVTQLFPAGHIINLHPWEHNEVPVLLGAALKHDVAVIALHLTRPPVEIPDRAALGMPSHFAAARGAYVVRDYRDDQPRGGTLIVQGTSAMANMVKILPELDARGLNVKVVCATSSQLFALQPDDYRAQVFSPEDWADSTVVTTQARWLMHDWLYNKVAEKYALSADWDNNWRTGGTLDEIIEEAHLSPEWLLDGIARFVQDRDQRINECMGYPGR
jgi:transketolase